MKQKFVVAILSLLGFAMPAKSQYVVQVPYLFQDLYSTSLSVGYTFFSIPRPNATYQSVRLRGLSEGFIGLVQDTYSDHFRNPAYRASDVPVEFFGDFGSVANNGNFLVGSVMTSGANSWAGFVTLEGLRKYTSSSDQTSFSSYGSTTTSSSTNEYSPRKIGGRLSYTAVTANDVTFGVSYEYSSFRLNNRYESFQDYSSPSYPNTTKSTQDYSRDSKTHRISAGVLIPHESTTL